MRAEELLKYVQNPHLLNKESIPALQQLVKDFPYFQSAHLLLSLASKKWDASVYQQSLKKTAIVATNRSHLYNLIHHLENEVMEKEEIVSAKDEAKKELDILKSAEVSVEENKLAEETKVNEPVIEQLSDKPAEDLATGKEEEIKHYEKPDKETIVALEIEKSLVNSFVEKELLKTNEIHHKETLKTDQPESFGDWLKFLKKNNGQSYSQIEEEVSKGKEKEAQKAKEKEIQQQKEKEKKKAILDKIIETNPGVIRQKEDQKFFKSDLKAKESLLESEHLVTETLARIYALQGNINKAVRAYEILSLKYPQKSAYFASLIQKLKSNQ
jgi:hypothetical protein